MKTGSWRLKRIATHIRDLGGSDPLRARNGFSRQEYVQSPGRSRGAAWARERAERWPRGRREGSDRANSAKRIRAHEGCLGIGRRRRTRKTATSSGEPSTGVDPEVSEWGNPAGVISRHPRMNGIVRGSYTWGSETSQYPQEKRSNDIARVAASESAGAQTGELAPRGCGTRTRYRNG